MCPPSLVGDMCIKSIFAYVGFMGRTIPSYRLASEREKSKWKIFIEQLNKSEREMFDEMMSNKLIILFI